MSNSELEKLELQISWNNAKINVALGIENEHEKLKKLAEAIWGEKYRVDDFSGGKL
ncbi:MAG: hypothetical protein ACTSX6_10050 [Candidatus Heimdallarchaeaceae archaeon]